MRKAGIEDFAAVRLPETQKQTGERRLACAALANDRRVLTTADREREFVQNGNGGMIAEGNLLCFDQRCAFLRYFCGRRRSCFWGSLELLRQYV